MVVKGKQEGKEGVYMDTKIKQFVYRVRARLREQKMIDSLLKITGIGLFLAVLISLVSLVVPFFYAEIVAAGVIGLSFVIGVAEGIKKTPTPMEAALTADSKGHKERISTAFFLVGREDAFSKLQKKDALGIIERFQIRKEFPLRLQAKPVLIVLGLVFLFTVSSLVDTPAREMERLRHDVQKEAKEEVAKLEKVEKEIEKKKEISEAESEEIREQLETAKKELKEADSYEDLKKAEERIVKKMEMASVKTENKTLSETLTQAAKEAKKETKSKQEDLAEAVKEALKKAEKGSAKDKKGAYEKMKKLAEMAGDEALQKAAEEFAASDFSESDFSKANSALSEALASMSKRNSDLAKNNSNSQQNNQNGNGQGNQQSNGQGGSQGGQGSGGSGNGQGSGSGNGGGWNKGSKNGQEGNRKTNENITVPDGEVGNDENLTGKQNGNDTSTKEKSNQSNTWSGDKVDYGKVSGEYKDKAYKKVNGSNYPGKLKDKIRDYFNGLN